MTEADGKLEIAALGNEVQRLAAACQQLQTERDELLAELDSALARLEAAEVELEPMYASLERASVHTRSLTDTVRTLEQRLAYANRRAASAHDQLLAERAWASDQARAVAASQSWRVGHSLVRAARALGLKDDKGSDALTVIVRRMEDRATDIGAG
jgi:chromosome segregation ATPase